MSSKKGSTKRLVPWLRGISIDAAGSVRLVTQSIDDNQAMVILTWAQKNVKAQPEATAEDILDVAQADCDERRAPTEYRIEAVSGSGDTKATHTLRMQPANQEMAEEASAAGIIRMLMRRDEQKDRVLIQCMGSILNAQNSVVERQAQIIEALQGSISQAWEKRIEAQEVAEEAEESIKEAETRLRREAKWQDLLERLVDQHGEDFIKRLLPGDAPAAKANGSGGKGVSDA